MMGGNGEERQTLADIIMAKIDEKETQAHGDDGADEDEVSVSADHACFQPDLLALGFALGG